MARRETVAWSVLLWLCAAAVFPQSGKGGRTTIRDRQGQEVGWYEGSYALLIGVSDYTAGWSNLESVPGELSEVREALQGHGFQVTEAPRNPTEQQIRDAANDFFDAYGFDKRNRLLIFYSGHGYSFEGEDRGYLVPSDAPNPRLDRNGFLRKALPMSDVMAWARRITSFHALFLFDSCFSGTIFKTKALPVVPPHISSFTTRPRTAVHQRWQRGSDGAGQERLHAPFRPRPAW